MKLGQLTEYNMQNSFREKSYKNASENLFPDSFSENRTLILSLDQ